MLVFSVIWLHFHRTKTSVDSSQLTKIVSDKQQAVLPVHRHSGDGLSSHL